MKKLFMMILIMISATVQAETGKIKMYDSHHAVADTFVTNQVLKEKDPATALALCIFLGPLGIHRIYLGTSHTTAVAYILTGAGFGILWIADTILIIRSLRRKDPSLITNNRHYFLWNR